MSKSFVRSSKFRHVFGTSAKGEKQFTFIRGVNDGTTDGNVCAVNPKFVAVATKPQGGGAFLVFTHEEVGRVDPEHPQVRGHKGRVLDLAWNPFNDNVIASGDEHAAVYIWKIPEGGLTAEITEPMLMLDYHQKKIAKILWHPTAENILLTSAYDNKVVIWNLESVTAVVEIDCPDAPLCFDWNYDGSKFVMSCKDKRIRIYDAHSGECCKEWQGHQGSKSQMVAFTTQGILTTGFSRMSQRQYALWDEKTGAQIMQENLDESNGVNQITYDRDTGMAYFAAKGDSVIRYFEVTAEEPYVHYLSTFSAAPQTAVAPLPKRGCDVNANEVMRFFRVEKSSKGNTSHFIIIPTAMTVPRKSDQFQDDLYPDTPGDEPALTADEWASGKNKDPILISLKEGYKVKERTVRVGASVNRMAGATRSQPSGDVKGRSGSGAGAGADSGASSAELKALQAEIKSLKSMVESHEGKIASLEEKVEALEGKLQQTEGD